MAKPKNAPLDDLTFAGMRTEDEAPAKRSRRKVPVAVASVEPWQAVANECPCGVSAEGHRANRERVHIVRFTPFTTSEAGEPTAHDGIVMCVPKADIAPPWRTTDAYRSAALEGSAQLQPSVVEDRHRIGSDPTAPTFTLPRFDKRDSPEDRLDKVQQWRPPT